VREVARRDKDARFTALLHHVTASRLRRAYWAISPKAAPGVDWVTWDDYGRNLEANLLDLHGRVQSGRYRAKPSRRAYIPKPDGRMRPLGIASLEDKIVQRAVVEVLNAVYEVDFRGFSYGFRPGRGPHDALDALAVGIERKRVNWVLDADIRNFFGQIDHSWLRRFVEHRIADKRIWRLIGKWLAAGVIEDGQWSACEEGSPQGASASPLLANVYLHYVFDLWADHWRRHQADGDVIIVRFADDFIVGFQYEEDARRFLDELRERFARFGLELHPGKTRLIEFGRFAAENRARRGLRKPETQGRAGARCRRYRRSVSPTRPPNRTCPFLSIRLSTGRAMTDLVVESGNGCSGSSGGSSCAGGRPRRGDAVSAILVSRHRDLGGPCEPRAFTAGPVAPPAPSPELFPGQSRVLLAQPADHSPPQVVAEIREAALRRVMTVVVGPTPQDWVERVDQLIQREVRRAAACQHLDAVHDLAERSLAWERVGDVLASGPPGSPLDAEPEQVKAVVDVGDRCLLGRERQAHLLPHELGRLLLDRVGLGFGAADQHHEVVRKADHSVAGVALGPVTPALSLRA
jgi:group II intron reverse transcriptase/maturase